jgi:hypothetical protein
MRWLVTGLGVGSGLIAIAVVMRLSFLFWFGRGAMIDADLGWAYGSIAAVMEVVKALAPFWICAQYQARNYISAAVAGLMLCAAVAMSFTSAAGLAAQMRLGPAENFARGEQDIATLERDIKLLAGRRDNLAPGRARGEVEALILEGLRASVRLGPQTMTVGAASQDCKKPREAVATACSEVNRLRSEAARAEERDRLDVAIAGLRQRIEARQTGLKREGAEPDHQARFFMDAINGLQRSPVTVFGVQSALIFLIATVLELAAGWVLFLAIGYHQLLQVAKPDRRGKGDVGQFCWERIAPGAGGLTIKELELAFADWCWQQGKRGLSRRRFRREFSRLARVAGIEADGRNYKGIVIGRQAGGVM